MSASLKPEVIESAEYLRYLHRKSIPIISVRIDMLIKKHEGVCRSEAILQRCRA